MQGSCKNLPNNSPTSEFIWEQYNFQGCEGLEEGSYIWPTCTTLCFALGFPASIAVLWEMFKTYRRGTLITPNYFFILNLSVVHPLTYHKRKSLTPRVMMAGIVWTLTVANGIAYCLFYKLFFTMLYIVPFMIAVVISGICDTFILCTLIKSEPGRNNIHPQKQRAIQTLINSLVTAVISYIPPIFLLAIGRQLISSLQSFICTVGIPITITSTMGSAVMPILHLKNLGKLDRFRLGCCRKS